MMSLTVKPVMSDVSATISKPSANAGIHPTQGIPLFLKKEGC